MKTQTQTQKNKIAQSEGRENLKDQLIELLQIHGTSGNEKPVRDYLLPLLSRLMDTVMIDKYGNLLADKKCGNGNGATVLLSAHMDTVKAVIKDRELIETDDGVIMSNVGALGADDRAGIAIILSVLRNIDKLDFDGNIKVAFSTEEEIGCIGASKIKEEWYTSTDLAIVADRRGNSDIVVGCGMAFCSDYVGDFMMSVAKMADMDWSCVEGGISDALVFAESGVNSINLSVGYYDEHSSTEHVIIDEMMNTVKLILQTFAVINQFASNFGEVPEDNKWVMAWYPMGKHYGSYNSYYEDTFLFEEIWAEEADSVNGDIFVYETNEGVTIEQGDKEILMSRESLMSIVDQLKHHTK